MHQIVCRLETAGSSGSWFVGHTPLGSLLHPKLLAGSNEARERGRDEGKLVAKRGGELERKGREEKGEIFVRGKRGSRPTFLNVPSPLNASNGSHCSKFARETLTAAKVKEIIIQHIYTVSQKVPTFKLSVTLSDFNRFSQFVHCWKAYKIGYKTHTT